MGIYYVLFCNHIYLNCRYLVNIKLLSESGSVISNSPLQLALKQGRGNCDDKINMPLRLMFEAREGKRVVDEDVKRPSDSHLK